MGLVACPPGNAKSDLLDADYAIDVAGRTLAARPLARAPYDPDGTRLKG